MEDKVYDKKITCPVCKSVTQIKAPKKGSFRLLKKDSDLMQNYEGVNPLFYGIDFCNQCGYAALPTYFNSIRENQKKLIINQISAKWQKNVYEEIYTVDNAIAQHKLALLNAIVKNSLISEKSLICLRLSWLHRVKGDQENEKRFQEQAATGFEKAYQSEELPIGGLDEWNLLYIIGELYRRIGKPEKASSFFSAVLSSNEAPSKLKEMVRDVRELMK
ncbi:MAG: DUF2225 domain-containing protein [Clostridiaceae bacterium]